MRGGYSLNTGLHVESRRKTAPKSKVSRNSSDQWSSARETQNGTDSAILFDRDVSED